MFGQKKEIIDEIRKSDNEVLRVSLLEYRGENFVDVRSWVEKQMIYTDDPDVEAWIPTRKGLRISVKFIDRLIESLEKAKSALEKQKSENSI